MNRALLALACCAFIVNLGYGVVIPVLPTLVATSAAGVGVFYGVFSATKLLSQIAGGVLADKRGAAYVLAAAVVVYASSLAGIASAETAGAITAWRALEGVAVGLSYPCVSALVLGVSEKAQFARNHAGVLAFAGAGMVVGPVSATLVSAELLRPLLYGIAVAAVLSAVPMLGTARGVPRTQGADAGPGAVFGLLKSQAFLALLPPLVFSKLAFSIVQPLLPVRGADLALSAPHIGALFAANGVLFALTQPPTAWCCRRFGTRPVAFTALCVAIGALASMAIENGIVFSAATLVYATAGGFVFGANTALVGEQYHADRGNHGKVFAAMHMASDVCMIIAPVAFMWAYAAQPLYAFAGVTLVGIGLATAFKAS